MLCIAFVLVVLSMTCSSMIVEALTWKKDEKGWSMLKDDGSQATNEWVTVKGKKYNFDSYGYMRYGWCICQPKIRSNAH